MVSIRNRSIVSPAAYMVYALSTKNGAIPPGEIVCGRETRRTFVELLIMHVYTSTSPFTMIIEKPGNNFSLPDRGSDKLIKENIASDTCGQHKYQLYTAFYGTYLAARAEQQTISKKIPNIGNQCGFT